MLQTGARNPHVCQLQDHPHLDLRVWVMLWDRVQELGRWLPQGLWGQGQVHMLPLLWPWSGGVVTHQGEGYAPLSDQWDGAVWGLLFLCRAPVVF